MRWSAENGEVELGGATMKYAAFGQGKRVFVLIPGLADALSSVHEKAPTWAKIYAGFFERYRVYMFSRKDALPAGYSIREMARDQAEALRALGVERACVLGVSEGGMIAQYLAIDHPELVEKLALAVTVPRANEVVLECVGEWIERAERGNHRELMISCAERIYSPARLKKYRLLYPFIGLVNRPDSYERFLINACAILDFNASAELGRIACPTLIIGGEADRVVGVQASYELHALIPGSELCVYPGLGHGANEEAADFGRRILDFMDRE